MRIEIFFSVSSSQAVNVNVNSTPSNLSPKEFTLWSPARTLEQESSTSQIQIQSVNNNRRLLPQFNQIQVKSESSLLKKFKKEDEAKDEQKIFPVSLFLTFLKDFAVN